MSEGSHRYRQRNSAWGILAIASVGIVAALAVFLKQKTALPETKKEDLVVYCAAGIRKPVEEAAHAYEQEFGVNIRLDYGSSGEMESKLALSKSSDAARADIYIPADEFFADRARDKGLTAESIPLAKFRLVLAVKPGSDLSVSNIDGLLASGAGFAICDEQAGVGKKTKDVLTALGKWDAIKAGAKASFARVPEAANAVKTSDSISAAFLWDSNAKQFGLTLLNLPELDPGVATISANVTTATDRPTQALHFARYLAAPEKSEAIFTKHYFETIQGDAWADHPELVAYICDVNRNALEKTLAEFEAREGCTVQTTFAGCGTIVGNIQAGEFNLPDTFMTCDASYLAKVQTDFLQPRDVSSTKIIMLVRKGNPKGIHTLTDLVQDGLKIGTTEPRHSTLGALSWSMFEEVGIRADLEAKKLVVVTSPTAHELILQMEGHDKLDVALVYEANCQNLTDRFDQIPIDMPRARAVQNIAVCKQSKHPQMTARLMQAILSTQSRDRFLGEGFSWEADAPAPKHSQAPATRADG